MCVVTLYRSQCMLVHFLLAYHLADNTNAIRFYFICILWDWFARNKKKRKCGCAWCIVFETLLFWHSLGTVVDRFCLDGWDGIDVYIAWWVICVCVCVCLVYCCDYETSDDDCIGAARWWCCVYWHDGCQVVCGTIEAGNSSGFIITYINDNKKFPSYQHMNLFVFVIWPIFLVPLKTNLNFKKINWKFHSIGRRPACFGHTVWSSEKLIFIQCCQLHDKTRILTCWQIIRIFVSVCVLALFFSLSLSICVVCSVENHQKNRSQV